MLMLLSYHLPYVGNLATPAVDRGRHSVLPGKLFQTLRGQETWQQPYTLQVQTKLRCSLLFAALAQLCLLHKPAQAQNQQQCLMTSR